MTMVRDGWLGVAMSSRSRCVTVIVVLSVLVAGCPKPPTGSDPRAGILLYPSEVKPVNFVKADLPLRVWVENWGDQPFVFSGELTVQRDGSEIDTVPFGQLGAGAQEGTQIPVHKDCSQGQTQDVFMATIKYDSSISAPQDEVDVNLANNQSLLTDDVCLIIYDRYVEEFRASLLAEVNSYRTSHGLPAYTLDPCMTKAAQEHSEYLQSQSFDPFYPQWNPHDGHNPPSTRDTQRCVTLGCIAGCHRGNLHYLDDAHEIVFGGPGKTGWEDSAGHKANLDWKWDTKAGIGVAPGPGTVYYTTMLFGQ